MGPTCIADSWGLLNLEARHIYARISHSLSRARGFVLGMAFPIAPPPARARSRSARRLPMAAAFLAPSPDESPLLLALMDGDKVVQSRPGKFSLWGARLVVGPGGGCDGTQILCCHGGQVKMAVSWITVGLEEVGLPLPTLSYCQRCPPQLSIMDAAPGYANTNCWPVVRKLFENF